MKASALTARIALSLTLAAAPVGSGLGEKFGLWPAAAHAKNGNGGGQGNGGGNGNGGGGQGSSSGKSEKSEKSGGQSAHAGRQSGARKDPIANALDTLFGKNKTQAASSRKKGTITAKKKASPAVMTVAATPTPKPKPREIALSAKLGSLNSLNRNYHAYLNSSDPKLAAISAYAVAYAQYELANGAVVDPADPVLGDEALRQALLSASNKNRVQEPGAAVDEEVVAWAKDVLGVGTAVGKIDEIRDALAAAQAIEGEPGDDVTEETPAEDEIVEEDPAAQDPTMKQVIIATQ